MNPNLKRKSFLKDSFTILVLVMAILIPRLIGLDTFVTVDEPSWVGYGANTYYALGQRDIRAIVTKYSPGITTIWAGAASVHLLFPEYRGFGQGYLWDDDLGVADIMSKHGQSPMEILVAGRIFTILEITATLLMVYFYSRRLFGVLPAVFSVLLISFEPFYLGHSRLLTHEGLIAPLLLLSVLSFVTFLYQGRRKTDLFLSAFAGSIACLTKSSSTIIVPSIALISIIAYFEHVKKKTDGGENKFQFQFRRIVLIVLIWLVIFIVVYVALWPPMWVAPLKTLDQIYGNAFRLVFNETQPDRGLNKELSSFPLILGGFELYARVILTKTTPIVWLGFWIGLVTIITHKKPVEGNIGKKAVSYLLAFGGLFYCMMSLAANKSAAHYIMTTIVCLTYIAGIGLAVVFEWIRGLAVFRKVGVAVFVGVFILLQGYSLISYYPYYYPYVNPIAASINRGVFSPVIEGYGEGLDLAAKYLSEKPHPERIRVMSWYAGIPGYLFPGKVRHIKPEPRWTEESTQKLKRSDYLVIYYEFQLKRNLPEKLMHDLANVPPEHSISLYGVEYIRIYRVSELPDRVFVPDGQAEN